jgi:hypothetical protein
MMPAGRFDRTSFGDAAHGTFGSDDPAHENGTAKGPEVFRRFQSQLEELGDYARLYASAKKDALTSSVRRAALWVAVSLVAAAIAVSTVITATVLALLGLAQLIGEALGDRPWAGYLITGGGLLLLLAIGMLVALTTLQSKFRKQTVQKYERRHQAQRARFGHDESQRGQPQV